MTDVRESSGSAAFTPEIAVRAVSERRDRVGFRRIFYYWGKETKEGKRTVQRQLISKDRHGASIRGRAGNTTSFNYFHIDVMTYISNSNRKKDPANHSVCLCYQTHPSLFFPPEQ